MRSYKHIAAHSATGWLFPPMNIKHSLRLVAYVRCCKE
jgi:hypothetical protein